MAATTVKKKTLDLQDTANTWLDLVEKSLKLPAALKVTWGNSCEAGKQVELLLRTALREGD